MQTKLTLRLEDTLIEHAKEHARLSGKSLSQMVSDYFLQLDKRPDTAPLPPVTAALRGALASTSVDKEDYRNYLEGKYR
jgi:hypothetical protein